MPEKDKILRAVCNGLNSLKIKPWGGNTMATETVKNKLRQIGQGEFGCYVCASGVPRADCGEWLYDVTWLKYDCDDGSLIDAPLVAECEWGNLRDIDDDFQKLLLARASVRLMIFGGWDERGSKKKLERMAKSIEQFSPLRNDKDAWLLVPCEGSENDGWSFKCFKIEGNTAIPFSPSSGG